MKRDAKKIKLIRVAYMSGVILVFFIVGFLLWQKSKSSPDLSTATAQSTPNSTPEIATATPADPAQTIEAQTRAETNTPILMYHHVKTNSDPANKIEEGLDVPTEQFELQMKSLNDNGFKTIHVDEVFLGDDTKKAAVTFDDGYRDVITNAYPVLQKFNMTATLFVITNSVGKDEYLSWDDINTLKNAGWEIGSHTLSHPDLSKSTAVKVQQELAISKEIIETHIGSKIESFCYPSGKYNDEAVAAVKTAGYKFAVTTKPGRTNAIGDILILKRVRINGPDSLKTFENKVF